MQQNMQQGRPTMSVSGNSPQQMQSQPVNTSQETSQGPQRVKDTQFHQEIQNVLFSRIEEEYEKNPNFGQAIEGGLSQEAAMEIGLIIPEILPLLRAVGLAPNAQQNNTGIRQPQRSQAVQQPEPNPLTNNDGLSKGLVG